MSDTLYIDFHTHHPSREGECVVQDGVHTWGIHPWQAHLPRFCPKDERGFDTYPNEDGTIPEELFSDKARALGACPNDDGTIPEEHFDNKEKALGICPNDDAMHFPAFFPKDRGQLLAIGECGLDVNAEASLEVQSRLLKAQLRLAMHWQLPVILHCVKQLDPLIALRKDMKPHEAWIMHGFRGKPQQLKSLLQAGFHVSFGFRFNPHSLLACPIERLLLETDDDERPVRALYEEVANLKGMSKENLAENMRNNFETIFRRLPQPAKSAKTASASDFGNTKERLRGEKYGRE